ncbi:MAG: lptC [Rhodospirillales bacterium]|jgi:lipopolysaccharide export system protein LptC|nr:lptC [Rhodospirillales bacterium]
MTTSPDPATPNPPPSVLVARRMIEPSRARRSPTTGEMTRRRITLAVVRRALPIAACLLLAAIVLWPELNRTEEGLRVQINLAAQVAPEALRVAQPRYRGLDEQNRPYNVTADIATQAGTSQNILDLINPRADQFLGEGAWVMVESREGRFDRAANRLDLAGDVTLWHDNGTRMRTEQAMIRMNAGYAEGDAPVAAQGPFGTLTSEGFRIIDRGQVVIFTGRAHTTLESAP